jgi:hypothetical protein
MYVEENSHITLLPFSCKLDKHLLGWSVNMLTVPAFQGDKGDVRSYGEE